MLRRDQTRSALPARRRRLLVPLLSTTLLATAALQTAGPAPAHADLASSALPAGTALPFDLPSKSTLRSSPRKVFVHWVPSLPVSLDNQDPSSDYYQRNYLSPYGEGGKNVSIGGFLRDRPLPRAPRSGDWRLADMKDEVRQATVGGIDGFSTTLYTLSSTSRNYQNNLLMMKAAAEADPGFKIMLQPDMSGGVGSASAATLAKSMAQLGRYSSAYRYGGKLVVSPFAAQKHSVAWWRNFMSIMKNTYGMPVSFWPVFHNEQPYIADFAPISDVMSNWGSRNPAWTNPDLTYSTGPAGRIKKVHALGEKWMQPVSVQDERPREGLFDEAENTHVLRNTWRLAIENKAEMVQINTWNDLPEGSGVEPSPMNGSAFLDMNAYWLTKYKTGVAPKIVRDTVYLTHRKQPWAAKPTFPQTLLMKLRGGTPARDKIEALTFLKAPGTVKITVGTTTVSCSVPAGPGLCTVPLRSGTVSAKVVRNGATTTSVTSPMKVTSSPYVQNLRYGAVSSGRTGSRTSAAYAAVAGEAVAPQTVAPQTVAPPTGPGTSADIAPGELLGEVQPVDADPAAVTDVQAPQDVPADESYADTAPEDDFDLGKLGQSTP